MLNVTIRAIAELYDILVGKVLIAPNPGIIKILGSDDFRFFHPLSQNSLLILPLLWMANARFLDGTF